MLLSICIPTHHGRAAELQVALDSILSQLSHDLRDEVEICVSDNASQDRTAAVVGGFHERLGDRVAYRRTTVDRGFTENLVAVVEMATADHCWLFGSDDAIADGGLRGVVELISRHPGVTGATLNRSIVDHEDLENGWSDPPGALPSEPETEHVYLSAEEAFRNCAFLQDYMSAQIVHRDRFLAAVAALGPEGLARAQNFPHVAILGRMIKRDPAWLWYPHQVVRKTVGTTSLESDSSHRFDKYQIMVVRQRAKVWGELFGRNSPLWKAVMRRAYFYGVDARSIRYYKAQPNHSLSGDLLLLASMTREFYWLRDFWRGSLPVLLVPYPLVRPARALRERLRRAPLTSPKV